MSSKGIWKAPGMAWGMDMSWGWPDDPWPSLGRQRKIAWVLARMETQPRAAPVPGDGTQHGKVPARDHEGLGHRLGDAGLGG